MHNQVVAAGYDKVSEVYRSDTDNDEKRIKWCERILELCPNSTTALDIGCGCGIPVCKYFSEHGLQTVGIDISPRQIERAMKLAPQATYFCSDYLSTNNMQYDIITAFYAIIHIDRTLHQQVFKKVFSQLKDGGVAVVTVGHNEWEGYEDNWLGVEGARMYWSHFSVDKYIKMLQSMNFSIIYDEFIPEGSSGHNNLWLRKSG